MTYVFLLDETTYLNHIYLACLVSFLMALCRPIAGCQSMPGLAAPRLDGGASLGARVLRFQIAIPYTYGGIAKLNGDWLQGEPVRMWFARKAVDPIVGPLATSEWTVGLVAYGGLPFDLAIVPMLLWRRTRMLAFLLAVGFHLSNAYLFSIGIFPWFMIAATLLFFPPDWPRTLWERVRRCRGSRQPPPDQQTRWRRHRLADPEPALAGRASIWWWRSSACTLWRSCSCRCGICCTRVTWPGPRRGTDSPGA